jgi:predicted nucleic acid-binding protein
MYLPDTNIFINAFRNSKPEDSFLEKATAGNNLAISVVVITEFLSGIGENEEVKKDFYKLLDHLKIISVNRDVAEIAGEYRKKSLKTTKAYLADCFLAAQAKKYNLTLVTNNTSDFPMKDIKIARPR